ncbi:MAG: sugar transferase [Ktedonobacteraceae bacterium]|nr:sugar transferase [Ktedonobacteraceae bacterium]
MMIAQSIHATQIIRINPGYLRLKRFLDILLTLLILPFLCIVVAIVAAGICLNSRGPVFYRQKRIGQDGKAFEMYKFRSMYVNSSHSSHQEAITKYINGEKLNAEAGTTMAYKQSHDPRITTIGRFLRKTSIDELPQFFNVLRGEMSLVGPRPPVPYEVELYSERDLLRLAGKPGLTGVWQVYGRSRVGFQEMVEMDIRYLHSQSLWQDIKLIVLTVPVMILGHGGA